MARRGDCKDVAERAVDALSSIEPSARAGASGKLGKAVLASIAGAYALAYMAGSERARAKALQLVARIARMVDHHG